MPNVAQVLKEEITRLARRAIRDHVEKTRKAASRHQREIAELKRQVRTLERQVNVMQRHSGNGSEPPPAEPPVARVRFSAQRLRAQRNRVELSAAEYAKLVGVSAQTIYNWERGATRPSQAQKLKLAELRGVGKREARARLAAQA